MIFQEMKPVTGRAVRGRGQFIIAGMKSRCRNCGDPNCVGGGYFPLRAWSLN